MPSDRRRRWWLIASAPLAAACALLLWIHAPRGPVPDDRFLKHRGTLAVAEVLERSVEDGVVTEEILLSSTTGVQFPALLQYPEGIHERIPALLVQGGFRTGRNVVRHAPKDRAPIVWASLDYQFEFPAKAPLLDRMKGVPKLAEAAEKTVGAALLLLEYLETRSEVDASRTFLVGGSLGGFFATVEAAIDPRADGLVLICIGGGLEDIVGRNLPMGSWQRVAVARALRPWLAPVDPLHYVTRVAPRPLLMVNASNDTRIPEASVLSLFERAGDPKEITWIEAPHKIQGDEALTGEVMDAVLAWMRDHGWLSDPNG